MAAMTNALLLILFALLGSGKAFGDKQANIPVRQLNNGTSKNSASYVMSVQYSHGSSPPHPSPERPSQNSAVRSSNSATPMVTSTPRPAVSNIKVLPVRKATNSVVGTSTETPPAPKATTKVGLSPANKAANPVTTTNVEVSSAQRTANRATVVHMQTSSTRETTNQIAGKTKQAQTQVQQSAVRKPSSQKTIVTEVTYPDSFISAQIAAASLTTPTPDTYIKPAVLQQTATYSSWNIKPQTTIDRSYSVANPVNAKQQSSGWQLQPEPYAHMAYTSLNPAYVKSNMPQQPAAATSTSAWQLQQTESPIDTSYSGMKSAHVKPVMLQPAANSQANWHQTPIDRAYTHVNPMRYYPYNTLRQSTLVEPYIDKRNHKYKQYSLSRHPSQHHHSPYPIHSVYSHPYDNYYNRRPPIDRESPPFFKPYPTKYVNFPPHRFPTPYNGLLNFSRHRPSYKENPFSNSSSGSLYYKILFPLALLGISIPALGMMYTYLSKRRRRSADDFLPSTEDIEYYMQMLQKAVETYQQNDVSSHEKDP